MRIALIVEGETEKTFMPHLRRYLQRRLVGRMPKLDSMPYDGHIPTGSKLKRIVENLLAAGARSADHVIALTDVYTGSHPREFADAADAKNRMRQWVGPDLRFHPHAAQHDFEAWLLPYWDDIQRLAGHNRTAPPGNPESVNHDNPPAFRIREIFRIGSRGKTYVKPRDAGRILRDKDLSMAISQCPELKALINTILTSCGAQPLPE
jgi:hypothetical protein